MDMLMLYMDLDSLEENPTGYYSFGIVSVTNYLPAY